MILEKGVPAGMAAKPRDAATLILLRDRGGHDGGIEVLMLQRHARSAFLPGVHVFPGGAVEEADFASDMAALCRDLSVDRAHQIIQDVLPPEKSLGFFVAAIREAFEESGILLAHGRGGRGLVHGEQVALWSARRAEVHVDPSRFVLRLRDEGLMLAADRLHYFAHWITPEALPIRFDARFFVAAAPSGQPAAADDRETVEARWIPPRDALIEHQMGRLKLAPPTFHSLTELADFRTVNEAIASTVGKTIVTRYG